MLRFTIRMLFLRDEFRYFTVKKLRSIVCWQQNEWITAATVPLIGHRDIENHYFDARLDENEAIAAEL